MTRLRVAYLTSYDVFDSSAWPVSLSGFQGVGFHIAIDFYPLMSDLCREIAKGIYTMESAALRKCRFVFYTSEWAAQSAVKLYGVDVEKVKVIPWGPNIECDRTPKDIHVIAKAKSSNPCRLLFVGSDWRRKGEDRALKVAQELNKMGLNTELTIVGCQPLTGEPLPSFVRWEGFINKYTAEGREKMEELLAASHFLILPTRADCTPLVLTEANSFGVPCLATNVGGIGTIINDGVNGKLFASDAPIAEYCEYVMSLMGDYHAYQELALSSFHEYQTRLNWSVVCQTAKQSR
jgi:glycosyltransferase involved in cell wall biosynthesis